MQAAYFVIAVRAAGLAAGPMGGFDSAGLDGEFFPSGNWRSFLIVNIGDPAALVGLSRGELAVARLVATGLTDREVASQLHVSVKTVEYHLRNSYIKLDITSRRALTALLRYRKHETQGRT
jgi:DNA-binding CsgD family transcriptional regulator